MALGYFIFHIHSADTEKTQEDTIHQWYNGPTFRVKRLMIRKKADKSVFFCKLVLAPVAHPRLWSIEGPYNTYSSN